jgi:hypothetical protein
VTEQELPQNKYQHIVYGKEGWYRSSDEYVGLRWDDGVLRDRYAKIVSDTPTRVDLGPGRPPTYLNQTRELLVQLPNQMEPKLLYGCQHCSYVRERYTAIRPHLSRHSNRVRKATAKQINTKVREISLADAIRDLSKLEEITRERDQLRAEYNKVKAELAKIRRAFKSLAGEE